MSMILDTFENASQIIHTGEDALKSSSEKN